MLFVFMFFNYYFYAKDNESLDLYICIFHTEITVLLCS